MHGWKNKIWDIRDKRQNSIPIENPMDVKIPIFLEYWIEFFTTITKSGPGLIKASKWIPEIVSIK